MRRELGACERLGISHSHYLGGPPRWTHEDRAKVEAYEDWKANLCPSCNTHADWWDPAKGGHRFAFVTDSYRCPGCELKEQERDQIPDKTKGVHVFLTPNPELIQGARHG